MNKLSRFFTAAALTSALVFAQGPGMGRMGGGNQADPATRIQFRVEMLTKRLGLTDTQKASATTIYTDAETAAETARANLSTLQETLSAAVKTNNTGTIDATAAQIGTVNGQVLAIQTKAEAALYAILTPDQQTKFDSTPHGPGGMGMSRGGPQAMRSRTSQ
ncbi:Spy/CpxP family protein refolding chaperone [uncultured Paludibaculum sp.]|uniref:Spy/CpxP family protein refolding chaperone n=1 Tax=uncultured Paludibaculum sp. TaxID=1765020 RepID=UPI002AABBA46|nr:Spy/CpxP family protein refolding chaperone [uncultured Paludibaculum sp.]